MQRLVLWLLDEYLIYSAVGMRSFNFTNDRNFINVCGARCSKHFHVREFWQFKIGVLWTFVHKSTHQRRVI